MIEDLINQIKIMVPSATFWSSLPPRFVSTATADRHSDVINVLDEVPHKRFSLKLAAPDAQDD